MVRGNARSEANPVLWNGGIIHRRHPQTAATKFMAEPAHTVAIPDHQRHNIGGGLAGIDAEPV